MKLSAAFGFVLLLAAMLAAMANWMSWRVALFGGVFAFIWFTIVLVLLARPPGMPQFVSDEFGSDEHTITRRDVITPMRFRDSLPLALGASCAACFTVWATLTLLGNQCLRNEVGLAPSARILDARILDAQPVASWQADIGTLEFRRAGGYFGLVDQNMAWLGQAFRLYLGG